MGKNENVSYIQTNLPTDVAIDFKVLCLRQKTSITAKLQKMILEELEFWKDIDDTEMEEMLAVEKEGNKNE